MVKSNEPNVLFFKTEGEGHALGHSYWTIAKDLVQIHEGDVLEYDIFIDIISPLIQSGVDLHFTSGRCLRDAGILDHLGNSAHPLTYLYDAKDTWFHRKMDLSKLAGETIESLEIAFVGHLRGVYISAFKNIQITRREKVKHTFYNSGPPKCIEKKMGVGFSDDVIKPIKWEEFRQIKAEHFDLMKISPEIRLAEKLTQFMPDKRTEWLPLLEQAKARLDIEAYKNQDDERYQKSLSEVRQILGPILKGAKTFTTHLIGHAHIDMNWLWIWDETVAVCQRDFDTMTRLMEKYPFFKFSQSQGSVYKAVQKTRPDLFERIREYVHKGQWEITAAMWVEGDENMASGEALVRQFLLAKRYIRHHFGVESVVCWQPDLFGHVWTMPQILKKCGVKYYYFMRCAKESPSVFWWQGPDGSRVLAATTPDYNGSIHAETPFQALQLYEKQGVKDFMHCYGVGDHGGGPTIRDIDRGLEMMKDPVLPKLKFNTVQGYFDSVASKYKNLPVVNDELQFIFEGCYTTHADIKLRNRQCENIFSVLELFSVMAMPYEFPYPQYVLNEGWERTCFNQFHDILPGSGIHPAAQEALPITNGVIAGGKAALKECLTTLANQITTRNKLNTEPLIVFNPNNWIRNDVVTVQLPLFSGEWVEVLDEEGVLVPCQIASRSHDSAQVLFVAENVPSIGYKTFGWRKVEKPPIFDTSLSVSDDLSVETEFYKIKVHPDTGCITSLILKEDQQEFIEPGKPANVFQILQEKAGEMSAWKIGEILDTNDLLSPIRVEILEKGPVRAMLQVVHREGASQFIQRIAIYHNLGRIDFPCTVDWREIGSREKGSKLLKVAFPLNLAQQSRATFEIPFGHIERAANGHEYPSQKWIDVSDSNHGVSLLNDCKYGHDVQRNVMRLSLLRCSYEPDPIPDKAMHHFAYSLVPHKNDWKIAGTLRAGYELNQPLLPVLTDQHAASLPAKGSFVNCSAENIIITALKKCEDDDQLILRFYESHGHPVKVSFSFSFNILSVTETDLIEREIEDAQLACENNRFTLPIGAYEIKTVKIKREPFRWPKHHNFKDV